MKGVRAGRVRSSTSKLMAHCRAKYSDGASLQVGAEAPEGLGLLVEPLQPEGGPPAGGLQEDAPQSGVALEGAQGDELGTGQHLLEGMGDGVEDERVEGSVRSQGRDDHRAPLVNPDRDTQFFGHVPQRVVGPVRQGAAQAGVGPDEGGREGQLGGGAPQLGRGGGGVLQGEHGGAEEPPGRGGAVRSQPVVVGPGHGDGGHRIGDGGGVESDGGVQHGLVDPLAVHVGQAGHRIGPTRLGLFERAVRGGIVEGGPRAGQGAEGHGQDLLVADGDVLIAGPVAVDLGPMGVGKVGPGGERLDDVAVGIDDGAGAGRERSRRHGAGVRQSSRSGRGCRNSPCRVAPGDGSPLVFGQGTPIRGEDGLGVGPRGIGMGIVALHHDVIDPDDVAQDHGGRVVDGAVPEVPPQDLAGPHGRRPGRALVAGGRVAQHVVGPIHEHGHPPDAPLGHGDVQAREAQGHPRPQPFAAGHQGVDREEGGQQLEGRIGGGQRRPR